MPECHYCTLLFVEPCSSQGRRSRSMFHVIEAHSLQQSWCLPFNSYVGPLCIFPSKPSLLYQLGADTKLQGPPIKTFPANTSTYLSPHTLKNPPQTLDWGLSLLRINFLFSHVGLPMINSQFFSTVVLDV